MRRLLPLAGLALAFLFLGGITLRTLRAVEAPSDPAERKLAEAKRYLYYIVTRSEGPEFQLAGHERDLYIVSHGVLPGAPPFDPARQLTYGLRLSALLDGKEVWARELYTRSRQSKARRAGGVWLDEAAFSLERGVEVTDDRLLVARLPDALPAGAVLRFRLAGDSDGEALVRVYERTPRAAARVELRLRSLAPSEREELAAALSFTPWDRLDGAERTARLRSRRLRMSAVGREGQGYRTRALHVSDFRLPLDEPGDVPQAGTMGTKVSPARSAALNIVGPVELRLVVARGPADQPSLVPAALEIRWIGEGGQPPPLVLPVPPAPTEVTQTVSVPAGLHSLHLHTDAREGVRVALTAPAGSQAQLGVPATPGAEEPLLPHEALLWGTVLAKDTLPLVLSVPGDELIERIVRVDARLLPEAAPPESPVGGALTVETFDHAGRRLTRQEVQLASQVSRFEEVRLTGVALPRPVAEPASFRLIAPAGARRIVVQAAQPTFVRAHALATLSPEPDALEAPFDAVQLQSTVWRHAPLDERSWLPLQPLNRAALADREARLAAQVRRSSPAPGAPGATGADGRPPSRRPSRGSPAARSHRRAPASSPRRRRPLSPRGPVRGGPAPPAAPLDRRARRG